MTEAAPKTDRPSQEVLQSTPNTLSAAIWTPPPNSLSSDSFVDLERVGQLDSERIPTTAGTFVQRGCDEHRYE